MKKKTSFKLFDEAEKAKLVALLDSKEVNDLIAKTKESEDTGTFTGLIISTEHVDRAGEIVKQDGLDSMLYMKNPVVLDSHDYYGLDSIIGCSTRLYRGDVDGIPATLADGKFAPTEKGQMARKLYEGGFWNTQSVGFIAREFDQNNSSIITKWEMLEFSGVCVPANGWAARLNALGLTEASLRAKGFRVKHVDKDGNDTELGTSCEMPDGGDGVFAVNPEDPDGPLVCVPSEAKMCNVHGRKLNYKLSTARFCRECVKSIQSTPSIYKRQTEADRALIDGIMKAEPKPGDEDLEDVNDPGDEDALWENLKSEHDTHDKAIKGHLKEFVEGMKAAGESGDQKSLDNAAEHEKKLKTVLKAEHDRHIKSIDKCWKAYKPKPDDDSDDQSGQGGQSDDDVDNQKMIAALLKSLVAGKLTEKEILEISMKAGRTISAATREKLTELCQKFEDGHGVHQEAIDEFKAFLESAKPTEGNDGKQLPPEKRSISSSVYDGKKDIPSVELVAITKTLNQATADALAKFKDLRTGVRDR